METLRRLVLVVVTAGVFILCDAVSGRWGKQGGAHLLILLCILAPLGFVLFGLLNRTETLSASSALVNSTIAVGTILVGMVVFHDPVSGLRIAGLVMAVAAVALLSL